MSIRTATIHDLDAIVSVGRQMHAESPRFGRLAYSDGKVRSLFTTAVSDPRYFTLAAEGEDGAVIGGFAGFVAPHWCSDDLVASDLAIFVQPDRRGGILAARMVKAFIQWADERGAKLTTLGISTGVQVEQTAALYRSIGLNQFGYLFEV